jgi:hypothetical protein
MTDCVVCQCGYVLVCVDLYAVLTIKKSRHFRDDFSISNHMLLYQSDFISPANHTYNHLVFVSHTLLTLDNQCISHHFFSLFAGNGYELFEIFAKFV